MASNHMKASARILFQEVTVFCPFPVRPFPSLLVPFFLDFSLRTR